MTLSVINSDSIGIGFRYTAPAAGDSLYVASTALVVSTTSYAFSGAGYQVDFEIAGQVVSAIGFVSNIGDGTSIHVMQGGSFTSLLNNSGSVGIYTA